MNTIVGFMKSTLSSYSYILILTTSKMGLKLWCLLAILMLNGLLLPKIKCTNIGVAATREADDVAREGASLQRVMRRPRPTPPPPQRNGPVHFKKKPPPPPPPPSPPYHCQPPASRLLSPPFHPPSTLPAPPPWPSPPYY